MQFYLIWLRHSHQCVNNTITLVMNLLDLKILRVKYLRLGNESEKIDHSN